MLIRMIKELDEYTGGLRKYIYTKLIIMYSIILICIAFAYFLNHPFLKFMATSLLIMPIVAVIIALPLWWYCDIKPITDKETAKKR